MTRTCPECDTELVDENQGYARLQYDYPHLICPNPNCEKSPYYRSNVRIVCPVCGTELLVDDVCPACIERNEELLKLVLGDEPYPDDLAKCYQNREMRILCPQD
jgi:ribosomal protein S27E